MNFGDILDAWEKQTAIPQGKKKRRELEKQRAEAGRPRVEEPQAAPQSPKKPSTAQAAPKPPPNGGSAAHAALSAWLDSHPVSDKDAAASNTAPSKGEHRHRLAQKKPDARIDLHGLNRDEAWSALEGFFRDCERQGCEKVLIVHGKGNHSAGESVLKKLTRQFIETSPLAGESGNSSAENGGTGSTWVILKRNK
jgi:DNA-nicking Smr family endonuclease